jgi:poly(3-hydroxybutyrate) depolymerase
MSLLCRGGCCLLCLLVWALRASAMEALPAVGADKQATSVSGLSSGAFMAVQYQVAFSSGLKGAGIVAGGPYYCTGTLGKDPAIVSLCMGQVPTMAPSALLLLQAARGFAENGRIDALANLKKARIYVFSGRQDAVVLPRIVDSTVEFFRRAGVPVHALRYDSSLPAGHAFITEDYGNACSANAAPYISHCEVHGKGYDQAGILLRHIYGKLRAPVENMSASVAEFDQREFAAQETGLADTAYVYVPAACRAQGGCRVHVVFHGCLQSAGQIGDRFYTQTGYNRWADSNRIIVLYPQVGKDTQPNSCWDWIGYTGPDYATRQGPQMMAVKKMVERLQTLP